MPLNKSILNSIKPFKAAVRGISRLIPDEPYIKLKYYWAFGKWPDLKHPKTFNEKLQWLKLHDRNRSHINMVDKYEAKKFISSKIGDKYVVPTYGIWDSFDEIEFDLLPNQFVLKTTHDCGGVLVCKDKDKMDRTYIKEFLEKHLSFNYYWQSREWPYKYVKPRIMAEALLFDNYSCGALRDYKFFCFNGIPQFMYIAQDKADKPWTNFYDMNFNQLPIVMRDGPTEDTIKKPECFEEMKYLAAKLSEGMKHIRIDFYYSGGRVYSGELTFYHMGGFQEIAPPEWADRISSYLSID